MSTAKLDSDRIKQAVANLILEKQEIAISKETRNCNLKRSVTVFYQLHKNIQWSLIK